MEAYTLDIYLDDVNSDYLNKISFLALFKSRSLGFRCSADLVSLAYKNYSDGLCEESIRAAEMCFVSEYIVSNYSLAFKEDLLYLLRHPNLLPNNMDPKQKKVRKKVLKFFDVEEPENEYKKEAFEYFKNMRPIKRASVIDKMLEQYLVLSNNEYYIKQAAARLMNDLVKMASFDSDGNLLGASKYIVDVIWATGTQRLKEQ